MACSTGLTVKFVLHVNLPVLGLSVLLYPSERSGIGRGP